MPYLIKNLYLKYMNSDKLIIIMIIVIKQPGGTVGERLYQALNKTRMSCKYLKRGSSSIGIREMQLKPQSETETHLIEWLK